MLSHVSGHLFKPRIRENGKKQECEKGVNFREVENVSLNNGNTYKPLGKPAKS